MFDFSKCTVEELVARLEAKGNKSRQSMHYLRKRYKDDLTTLANIEQAYAFLKVARADSRRADTVKERGTTAKQSREGNLWYSIAERCSENYHKKYGPNYAGCQMSESFQNFEFFAQWCNSQKGFNEVDANGNSWEIDKDILSKGSKIYSESTCVFVPKEINHFMRRRYKRAGEMPSRIKFKHTKNYYVVELEDDEGKTFRTKFDTLQKSLEFYKEHKVARAASLASKWKDKLDDRVYNILKDFHEIVDDWLSLPK